MSKIKKRVSERLDKHTSGNFDDKVDELPTPIKFEDEVPEYVYVVNDMSILKRKVERFVDETSRYKYHNPNNGTVTAIGMHGYKKGIEDTGGALHGFDKCYKSPDEAVKIFKSKEVK